MKSAWLSTKLEAEPAQSPYPMSTEASGAFPSPPSSRPRTCSGIPPAPCEVHPTPPAQVRPGPARRRLGPLARKHGPAEELTLRRQLLGGNMPAFALNFLPPRRANHLPVLQLPAPRPRGLSRHSKRSLLLMPLPSPTIAPRALSKSSTTARRAALSLGTERFPAQLHLSPSTTYADRLAANGGLARPPPTPCRPNREDLVIQRILIRHGFTREMAQALLLEMPSRARPLRRASSRPYPHRRRIWLPRPFRPIELVTRHASQDNRKSAFRLKEMLDVQGEQSSSFLLMRKLFKKLPCTPFLLSPLCLRS